MISSGPSERIPAGKTFFRAIKSHVVLLVAIVAAAVTCFLIPPDAGYADYFDPDTLSCLFCTLAVVSALKERHFFEWLSGKIVTAFGNMRRVTFALVFVTYFGSMIMANDMALVTFLPLGYYVLSSCNRKEHTAFIFVMQNVAANLGGMLTPFGNPQNLYLFSYYDLSARMFFSAMLPPFILSTVLILLCCLAFPKDRLSVPEVQVTVDSRQAAVYGGLFCLAVAVVLRLVPYVLGLTVIVLALWFLDRHALKTVDWGLLATFAAFFTFSGNLARMESVRALFARLLSHGTMLISALTCQIITMSLPPFCSVASRRMPALFWLASMWAVQGRWWLLLRASLRFGNIRAVFPMAERVFFSCFPGSALHFWRFF